MEFDKNNKSNIFFKDSLTPTLSPLKYKEKNQNSNIHHEVNYNWSHLTSDNLAMRSTFCS